MVDLWGDALGVAALSIAAFVAWFTWGQLKAQRGQLKIQQDQLESTLEQLEVERTKVNHLGVVVGSLQGMVETQRAQVAAVEAQLAIATRALKLQEETLAFEKARADREARLKQNENDLQAARLEWERMSILDKARIHIDHHVQEAIDGFHRWRRKWLGW